MTRALAASRLPSTHRTPPDLRLTNPAIGATSVPRFGDANQEIRCAHGRKIA